MDSPIRCLKALACAALLNGGAFAQESCEEAVSLLVMSPPGLISDVDKAITQYLAENGYVAAGDRYELPGRPCFLTYAIAESPAFVFFAERGREDLAEEAAEELMRGLREVFRGNTLARRGVAVVQLPERHTLTSESGGSSLEERGGQ